MGSKKNDKVAETDQEESQKQVKKNPREIWWLYVIDKDDLT